MNRSYKDSAATMLPPRCYRAATARDNAAYSTTAA